MDSVLKGRPAKASALWEDTTGEAIPPDGPVQATVVDALGVNHGTVQAQVLEDGSAQVDLPSDAVAEVGRLTLTWTGGAYPLETTVEVAGAAYATLGQLRRRRTIGDPRFPDWQLLAALRVAEATVESYCGTAFVPRFAQAQVDGCDWLVLPDLYVTRVLAATVGGPAGDPLDVSGWLVAPGGVVYPQVGQVPEGTQNVLVSYVQGWPNPPADLSQAVLSIVEELLVGSLNGLPDRATALTTDGVTYAIAQAGPNRPTGLPAVDATLNRYREVQVGVL